MARACIDQGIHYFDLAGGTPSWADWDGYLVGKLNTDPAAPNLADARPFVSGFGAALDAEAKKAGVVALRWDGSTRV